MKPQRGDKANQQSTTSEGEGSRSADEGDELSRAAEEGKQRAHAHPNTDSQVVPDPD